MRQVITVSLNGRAYQLEDDAYAVLSAYLAESAVALAGNPDKDEIIADLEQAIADKCDRYLNAHKTVVGRAELARIIEEMGPVDGAPAAAGPAPAAAAGATPGAGAPGAAATPPGDATAPKRLYQISEGALISGVCNGIAAYFSVDVTLVRLGFVAMAFLTGGVVVLAYLVLMFVVPYASTSEEHAAARGLPFNARALVERAKKQAAEFASSTHWQGSKEHWKDEWRSEWRRARTEWRDEWRRSRAEWRARRWSRPPPSQQPPAGPTVPYVAHVVTGFILAALGIVLALWTIGWLIAFASLVATGAIFGWGLPHDVPFWVGIVVLIVVYQVVAWPLKALRRAAYYPGAGYHGPWVAAWDGVVGVAILFALAWYGYHHVPEVRNLLDHLGRELDRTGLTV